MKKKKEEKKLNTALDSNNTLLAPIGIPGVRYYPIRNSFSAEILLSPTNKLNWVKK